MEVIGRRRASKEQIKLLPGYIDLRPQGVPGILVCGARIPVYRKTSGAQIVCVDTAGTYTSVLSNQERILLQKAIAQKIAELADRGISAFAGLLKRVKRAICQTDNTSTPKMALYLEETNYLEFLATNHNDKSEILKNERRGDRLAILENSKLANPLTVTINLITLDGYILLQRRNVDRAAHAVYPWQASFAGMVSPEMDYDEHGLDPYAAAAREGREELGLTIPKDTISFFGLARESRHLEVGLVGEVRLPLSRSEIQREIRLSPSEVSGIEFIKLAADSINQFIHNSSGGKDLIVPLAHITLAMSAWQVTDH